MCCLNQLFKALKTVWGRKLELSTVPTNRTSAETTNSVKAKCSHSKASVACRCFLYLTSIPNVGRRRWWLPTVSDSWLVVSHDPLGHYLTWRNNQRWYVLVVLTTGCILESLVEFLEIPLWGCSPYSLRVLRVEPIVRLFFKASHQSQEPLINTL